MAHVHPPFDRALQISAAERVCAEAGESLTPLRRQVLTLLLDTHGPAKAYDLLAAMKTDSGAAKPPTVYRALDFLVRMGLAHKLESQNAFVACEIGACARSAIFFICNTCKRSEEADAGHALIDLAEAAQREGFLIQRTMIEATGICRHCQASA
jgi:Fur family zinc uptake transcriptional regulator